MKRESSIDILKITAILSVIVLHYAEYFYTSNTFWGSYIVLNSVRWFAFGCIGYFILATGYLNCNKIFEKKYYKKLIPIIVIFFVYSILSMIIIKPIENSQSVWNYLGEGIKGYFWNYGDYYWYMNFYFAFFLIIPFLNIVINNISEKTLRWLIFICIFIISLPSCLTVAGDFWKPLKDSGITLPSYFSADNFPFIYYFIGAYLRKYKHETRRRWIPAFCLVGTLLLHSCLDYIYLNKYQDILEPGQHVYSFNMYGNVFTIASCTLFFVCLLGITIKYNWLSKTMAFLSSITLEMYLGLMIADKIVKEWSVKSGYPLDCSIRGFVIWFVGEVTVTLFVAVGVKLCRMGITKAITIIKKRNMLGKFERGI